jgi:hypothetical protein
MQRHETLLAVLPVHRQRGGVQVDVVVIKAECLAQAKPAGRDQADQGLNAGGRQGRGDSAGRVHERGDLRR